MMTIYACVGCGCFVRVQEGALFPDEIGQTLVAGSRTVAHYRTKERSAICGLMARWYDTTSAAERDHLLRETETQDKERRAAGNEQQSVAGPTVTDLDQRKAELLAMLDRLRARVEGGRTISVAIAEEHEDGTTGTCYGHAPASNVNTLIGATAWLHYALLSEHASRATPETPPGEERFATTLPFVKRETSETP